MNEVGGIGERIINSAKKLVPKYLLLNMPVIE
jgi:hypothetical protein